MASTNIYSSISSSGAGLLLPLGLVSLLIICHIPVLHVIVCIFHSDSIGHTQYISTIVKDHQEECRENFGVQFMLDVIRIFYR